MALPQSTSCVPDDEQVKAAKLAQMMENAQKVDQERQERYAVTRQGLEEEQQRLQSEFQKQTQTSSTALSSFSKSVYSATSAKGVTSVADAISRNKFYLKGRSSDMG
jgi:DNA-binding protein H-NS